MSINVNEIINGAVDQAMHRNKANALQTLTTSCDLTPEQIAKITAVLGAFQPDVFMTGGPELKCQILAVLKPEQILTSPTAKALAISQNQDVFISFSNDSTSIFANDYPCQFEFGGKHYPNATVCILAQQYTDQPQMIDLLIESEATEAAVALASLTPMTPQRKLSWANPNATHINQRDVMMHVQRAKFGQNPELKKQLQATGNSFLVCQGYDLFLSNNLNGTGLNILGTCLMQLRGEYCGMGIVQPDANYLNSMECLQTKCHLMTDKLFPDVADLIFFQCLSTSNYESPSALACMNNHWNQCSQLFWAKFDFKQLCPGLSILDAKMQGIVVDDEPRVSKLKILKHFKDIPVNIIANIEAGAGLTLLTVCKGLTLNQLVKIAAEEKITIELDDLHEVIDSVGSDSVEQTYRIWITNNVFINTRRKSVEEQRRLVYESGCVVPEVKAYVALCVFTKKIFNKCLYGELPLTYVRTGTRLRGAPFIVGGFNGDRLYVEWKDFIFEACGMGGGLISFGHNPFQ